MILSIFLLGFRSQALFVVAIVFLSLAAFFRVFSVNIWAERASIYVYQAILLATLVILGENLRDLIDNNFWKILRIFKNRLRE